MLLLLLTACSDCLPYSVCDDGSTLQACSNELTNECWYTAGELRYDCEGCNCEAASLEALEECQPGDTG